jgi:SulP family sulfate permease
MSDYDKSDMEGDLSAGVTVGVMLIPQSMAYAMLAGVPPIYGLYAGLIPLLIYSLMGTSRHLSVGPVTVDMLIVGAGVGAVASSPGQHVEMAILVAAMTGIIEILMGIFRFGFMVNFLSRPVIAGFMTAAPLIIAANQLDSLMGVTLADTQYIHLKVWSAIQHLGAADGTALAVGGVGIVFLFGLQKLKPRWPAALFWVVGATGASWYFGFAGQGLDTVGQVPGGLPGFDLQAWNLENVQKLAPTALTLALVQFMYVMSLGQAFASEHDYSIDANRELLAIGGANVAGSFFRSVPVSGSFSRSAVNNRSGANTPLANVIASSLVGLTLLFLTPLFQFLPVPALAAIIMVACLGMIDVPELRYLLQTRWIDGAVALITFGATLGIGIQQGILIGVAASIVAVLWDLSQPHVVELGHVPGTQEFRDVDRNPEAEAISDIHITRIDSRFSFANAKMLKEELLGEAEEEAVRALVIDTSGVNDLDTTATQALTEVIEELGERDIEFYVVGSKGPVRDVMRRSGLMELIGEENFYLNTHMAVSDLLERWDAEEEYEPTEQEQRVEQMDEAREKLEAERERVDDQRRRITQERKRLEGEIGDLEQQRSQLDEARSRLRQRLETVRKRRQRRAAGLDPEDEEQQLVDQREQLFEEEEEIEQRREALKVEQERLDEQKQELEDQQQELARERQKMEHDRSTILRERNRLHEEIAAHIEEREELGQTRRQLHRELERAEQQQQELEDERKKMEEQREKLEAERQRLEDERQKAE